MTSLRFNTRRADGTAGRMRCWPDTSNIRATPGTLQGNIQMKDLATLRLKFEQLRHG
jgi:hypothetical protein